MKYFNAILLLTLLLLVGCTGSEAATKVLIYKTPTCGCCGKYADLMAAEGFTVETVDLPNLAATKRRIGVPENVWDCHTAVIGDYFVEGHVPFEAVRKLLATKPDIAGVALPDMPIGTPGMPGPKAGPFVVLTVKKDGTTEEFGRY